MITIKKNILKSLLFACLGLTIATITFAGVRGIFSPPSSPGRPEATSIWSDRCTLKYLPPINNGGSRVTAFIIESKNVTSSRWELKGSSQYLYHTANHFTENSTHEFRVFAQNAAGIGKPSGNSNPVTFRDPYQK